MASEDNDAGMIDVAKKFFKSRCFTTDQVKNLSVLFLKNEGKYNFFDVAYPFVSDEYNFSTLETQLSEGYFITVLKRCCGISSLDSCFRNSYIANNATLFYRSIL